MFFKLFFRILAIFGMISVGILAKKLKIVNANGTRQMSFVITNFLYPALIFSCLVGSFSANGLINNRTLPACAILIMGIGYIFGYFFLKIIPFSGDKEKHTFHFQCTINNYSFLPMPIILSFWGNQGVAKLIFSSLGSEIAVWTIGIFALTGNKFKRKNIRNLASVPMMALIVSIATIVIRDKIIAAYGVPASGSLFSDVSESFMSAVTMFGKGTIPLAMFVAGSRMADLRAEHLFSLKQTYMVLLRLVAIPAVAINILLRLPIAADTRNVLLVLAIMPAAIASVVLSEVYNGDTEFAASSVLTTHALSLLTIPAWMYLLMRLQ